MAIDRILRKGSKTEPVAQPVPQPMPPSAADIDEAVVGVLCAAEKNHRYDLQTAAIIRQVLKPGQLAVDIGAHVGEILQWLVEASPDVAHLAIEPIPELAAGLRRDFGGVEVHEVALVAAPSGSISFNHVRSNPGYSGIKERRYDRPDEEVIVIDVPTARFDDLVGKRTVSLIKLDVEGAEPVFSREQARHSAVTSLW